MKQSALPQEPEAPARITEDHAQDRLLHTRAGEKMAWRKLSPLDKAKEKGQLIDRWKIPKGDKYALTREIGIGLVRYEAGKRFAEAWKMAEASFPTGSDLNRVRVVGVPGSFCDHAIDQKNLLRRVEAKMSANDYMIVRKVCGEEYPIGKTVDHVSPAYRDSTLARFREALDGLVEAFNG